MILPNLYTIIFIQPIRKPPNDEPINLKFVLRSGHKKSRHYTFNQEQ